MIELSDPCPLCGDTRAEVAIAGADLLHGSPGRYTMHACLSCGLWRLGGATEAGPVESYYPADYSPYRDDRPVWPVARPSLSHRLRQRTLEWISRGRPRAFSMQALFYRLFCLTGYFRFNPFSFVVQDKKLLDIGCADGHFLAEMAALGWAPFGVEQDRQAAGRAEQRGLTIFPGTFDQARDACKSRGPYDLVTLRQVLEHFDNPFAVLTRVYDLLAPGGFVAIWIPVRDGIAPRLFGRFWYNLDLPRHRVIFTRKTLASMVRQAGFEPAGMFGYSSARSITGSLANRKRAKREAAGFAESPPFQALATVVVKALDRIGQGDNVLVLGKKPAPEGES